MTPRGYQQVIIPGTNTGGSALGLEVPPFTNAVFLNPEGEVRWRDDREDPTDSEGVLLSPGLDLLYKGQVTNLRFFASGEEDVTLNVSYYWD